MYAVYINLLYFLSIFLFTYNKNLLSPPKKGLPRYLGSGTSVRKWDISYGTSSCITYFKLREHLTLNK